MLDAGGTIGSTRACGLARTQFLRKQYGELSQVFREIKDAFDPAGQLNPGKVIGDDPHLMLRNLKPWPAPPALRPRRSLRRGSARPATEIASNRGGTQPDVIRASSQARMDRAARES